MVRRDGSTWQLWILASLVLAQLLFVYHAYRLRQRESPRESDRTANVTKHQPTSATGRFHTDSSSVTCPDCGTANERDYRFCRSCVGELPVDIGFDRPVDSPLGRVSR